jgi:predicted enzyme related to lactoylglutathione lyase
MGPLDMAWFPGKPGGAGATGSLCYNEQFYKPSMTGTMVYMTAPSGDLANELGRVEAAGGKIMVPKTQISPEHGYMAVFADTEGNRVALHSQK